MRGKPDESGALTGLPRLIPAGAGKTSVSIRVILCVAAHPRRCGENHTAIGSCTTHPGSSPQVRGKRAKAYRMLQRGRLIPAGAGKTSKTRRASAGRSAHPRRCGENDGNGQYIAGGPGSSPQVRGKLNFSGQNTLPLRLIPAGAGKTHTSDEKGVFDAAHPRRCGENFPPYV